MDVSRSCIAWRIFCVVWKAGGYATASALYKEALQVLRDSEAPLEEVAKRTEMVVMFL